MDDNVRAADVQELDNAKFVLKSSFNAAKTARALLVKGAAGRNKAAILRAQNILADVKVHGLGKLHRRALREIQGMLDEVESDIPMAGEQHITAYLHGIRDKYRALAAPIRYLNDNALAILEDMDVKKYESKLNLGSKEYQIARVPIIPIINGIFNAKKATGVSIVGVGGYPMLQKQLVVGVTSTEKLADILRTLNEVTKKQLVQMTPKTARRKGLVWYWLADKHTANALMRGGNGKFAVKDWDFAF